MLDDRALAYRRLLADPCNGPLVSPCAIGPSTGLLTRQRYYITPTATLATSTGTRWETDFIARLQPALGVCTTVGRGGALVTHDLETGIIGSSVCHAYRAVAACMKWIPTGSIQYRSGVVSCGYIPDRYPIAAFGDTTPDAQATVLAKTVSNTGSGDLPEVKWIPSGPEDLEFRARDITYNADTASCVMVGRRIDGIATSNNTVTFNGYLEITIVYEWVPDYQSGVVSSIQAGSVSTLQSVLSTLGDLGRFAVNEIALPGLATIARSAARGATSYMAQRAIRSMAQPGLLLPG